MGAVKPGRSSIYSEYTEIGADGSPERAITGSSLIQRTTPNHRTFTLNGMTAQRSFWLDPVRLDRSMRFAAAEIRRVERVIEENQALLLRARDEYFGN